MKAQDTLSQRGSMAEEGFLATDSVVEEIKRRDSINWLGLFDQPWWIIAIAAGVGAHMLIGLISLVY